MGYFLICITNIVFTKTALEDEDENGATHNTYDPTASKSMKPMEIKSRFRIDYADGSWAKGDVVLVTLNAKGPDNTGHGKYWRNLRRKSSY